MKVREKTERLRQHYSTDSTNKTFTNECIHISSHLKLQQKQFPQSFSKLCMKLKNYEFDVFLYVNIAFRIYLSCPVSNCLQSGHLVQ